MQSKNSVALEFSERKFTSAKELLNFLGTLSPNPYPLLKKAEENLIFHSYGMKNIYFDIKHFNFVFIRFRRKRLKSGDKMTYSQTMDYLAGLSKFGIVLGLDNMHKLLSLLGDPDRRLKIIHIAGTNGKGSTGAFLDGILRAKGFRVGRYVSPAVFCYEERFEINGCNITHSALSKYVGLVREAAENRLTPTVFEVETAAALLYFADCDYVLLEVGMGGRLDATNAVHETLRSVITPIALDHTAYLGNTISEIAFEKAGIIRQNGVVISAEQQPEAAEVLKKTSAEKNAELTFCPKPKINPDGSFDLKTYKNLNIGLSGKYQYQNAALAIEVADSLFSAPEAVRQGISSAQWQGRFKIVKGDPTFIFDGAHNPHGAMALAESLSGYKDLIAVCGCFADKDYKAIAKITAPLFKKVFTVKPPSERGLDADILKAEFLRYTDNVEAAALETAISSAYGMKGCTVVVFGSLSFLGLAMQRQKTLAEKEK